MKVLRIGMCPALLMTLAVSVCWAQADLRGDDVDRLLLIDTGTVAGWGASEATVSAERAGDTPAACFRTLINWREGDSEHPIGWPGMQRSLSGADRDWGGWERIHLRVRTQASRPAFPYRAFSLLIGSGGKNISWAAEITGLRGGEWQDYSFDLSDLPAPQDVGMVGLSLSDDDYRHGDVICLWISDLELLRYRRPTLVSLRPVSQLVFADERWLPVEVQMLGVPVGSSAPVEFLLKTGDRPVCSRQLELPEGTNRVMLPVGGVLQAGEYIVSASAAEGALEAPFAVVTSPWQGRVP